MTRYQCIREILDTFDYYDKYVAHLDAWDLPSRDKRYSAETKFGSSRVLGKSYCLMPLET